MKIKVRAKGDGLDVLRPSQSSSVSPEGPHQTHHTQP